MTDQPGTVPGNADPSAVPEGGAIRYHLFGRTDVGQVREHNEDNFVVADLTRGTQSLLEHDRKGTVGPGGAILGVCDGMGGAAAGEVASQLAVDIVFEKMAGLTPPRDRDEFARRLVHAVEAAGLRIFSEAKLDRARRGMGTTATVAGLVDDHLFFAQVGDSRGYLLRGDRLVQVTRDQSLVNQLIEAGQLTEEEAETFEHNNIILQALGTSDTVQVDLTFVQLRQGDRIMMCSDGLSGMVRFDEIRETLLANPDPFDACRVLIERANAAGGHDNITVIVAAFDGEGLVPLSPTEEPARYRKYPLPEEHVASSFGGRSGPATVKHSEHPKLGADVKSFPSSPPTARSADHGPSRSKVSNTMLGGQLSADALAAIERATADTEAPPPSVHDDEPVDLPEDATPGWVVSTLVVATLCAVAVLAFYLLH